MIGGAMVAFNKLHILDDMEILLFEARELEIERLNNEEEHVELVIPIDGETDNG